MEIDITFEWNAEFRRSDWKPQVDYQGHPGYRTAIDPYPVLQVL